MSRNPAVFLAFFLLALLLSAAPRASGDEPDSPIPRILNPLPDYDPFEKVSPPPEFFPDEVSRRIHEVIVDSLTGREGIWEEHLRFFQNKDNELLRKGSATGLTERVLDLFHNSLRDRRAYLEAQRAALAAAKSSQQKRLIESRLRNDDLAQADELFRTGKTNRWGSLFNRFLGSVDLVGIASGSYMGAAVDSALSLVLAEDPTKISLEERMALTHYREHLKRYPADPQNPEAQKRAENLEKKKMAALVQKRIDDAEKALKTRSFTRAGFHYEVARLLDPSSQAAQKGEERLKEILQQRAARQNEELRVASKPDETAPEENPEVSDLLYSLTLRETAEIRDQAGRMEKKYSGKRLADSARDAETVALEIDGRHEEARSALAKIARSAKDDHARRRARQLLESPDYDLMASFRRAQSAHRLETIKYVVGGGELIKKNLLYGTAPLLASGPAAAGSLAAANVLLIGTNLYQLFTSNPVSSQAIIDKGEAYLRSQPQSESAAEVSRSLAQAYEDAGNYDKAIAYHQRSGMADDKKIAEIKEKAAKALLQAADKSAESAAREFYLRSILDQYPESPSAEQATRRLAAGVKSENQGLRISKKFLKDHPELYGPKGLGLKATLFDGNPGNMELGDQGIGLLNEGELLLYFQTPWGVRSHSYRIGREVFSRFQMMLRGKNYEAALEDVHKRAKGSPGGIRNLPLPLLRGEFERESESSEETSLALVREAGGPSPDFRKVLDYELLSENEKNRAAGWKLPLIQGSISKSGFDVNGSLPASVAGERLRLGYDEKSPFAGLELPLPYLQGFIPVDFLLQGGPGRFSIAPKIHLKKGKVDDQELYQ